MLSENPGFHGVHALLAALLCSLPGGAGAAPAVKLADHPTSLQTKVPRIHSIRRIQGRLYFGYGDWNTYPAVVLVSYDPATNKLILEHAVSSDSVEMIRECHGTIYVPHCDPAHYEDFHDYSYRGPDGRWLQSSALEGLHWFDFAQTADGLFAGGDGLYRSTDEGRSWTLVNSSSRCYFTGERDGAVFTNFGRYQDGVYTTAGLSPTYWNHSTPFKQDGIGATLMLGIADLTPGLSPGGGYNTVVRTYDGTRLGSLPDAYRSFTVENNVVHLLTAAAIRSTPNPGALPPSFSTALVSGIPGNATTLEILDGKYYMGTANGQIWTAHADGSPTTVIPPVVENRIGDAFGRGLALQGDTLLVGAPDASGAKYLAGQAEIWEHQLSGWEKRQEMLPPLADFSGWFGKDVAIQGDLAAVLESGHDSTNEDRGSNAKVHLYQSSGGTWNRVTTLPLPFAHSLSFVEGMLAAGTSNPAANQAEGTPGVKLYPITRGTEGQVAVTTTMAQLLPGSSGYGYKAVARVVVMDDLVIAGFSGDPSREAIGMISVFKRQAAGNYTRVQELSLTGGARFGFGLAAHQGWVAVGAPFSSTQGPHSGGVYLYQRAANPLTVPPLVLKQTLPAPATVPASLQAQGEFGASVALHGSLLLIGRPGLEVEGSRQRGAVYKYRLAPAATNPWRPAGELARPSASVTEFGIEVACNDRWLAAGSLGCAYGATGLTPRVRLVPRSGYEEWMDGYFVNAARTPAEDADADATPNLLEYAFNAHPLQASFQPAAALGPEPSGLPQWHAPGPDGTGRLTFVRPVADPRITLTIEHSGKLDQWSPAEVSPEVIATGSGWQLVSVALPATPPHESHYWRVKATYTPD